MRSGLNAYSAHALAAYVIAVAATEAFVNETLASQMVRAFTRGSALWHMRADWLERLELRDKIILITELVFGKALDSGAQPLQDLILLLRVRNEVVHYKFGDPPNFMNEFVRRGIALTSQARNDDPEIKLSQPWALDLSCTEGNRWAHNTCCRIVHAVVDNIPIDEGEYQRRRASSVTGLDAFHFIHSHCQSLAGNFAEISDSDARELYRSLGLEPDS